MSENLEKYYGCIYITTNMINEKGYTGQSTFPKDVLEGRYKGSGDLIGKAIKKYGWDAFKSEIIEYVELDINKNKKENQVNLDDREEYYIEKFNTISPNGYNLMKRSGQNGKHHKESKEKMSINNATKRYEVREKISKSRKGKKLEKEVCEKISKANKGRVVSINTRSKISVSNKGKKLSDNHKRKLSEANSGKKLSKDHKEKVIKSLDHSSEVQQKRSNELWKNNGDYMRNKAKESITKYNKSEKGRNESKRRAAHMRDLFKNKSEEEKILPNLKRKLGSCFRNHKYYEHNCKIWECDTCKSLFYKLFNEIKILDKNYLVNKFNIEVYENIEKERN